MKDSYIRFDWAIKRLLRQKANFGVLKSSSCWKVKVTSKPLTINSTE